jgi:coenzyme PQQ synthesis protein D (PqqD)
MPELASGTVSARYCVNKAKAIWCAVDGEAALIHVDTSIYYGLNATGTFIWTLLAEAELSFDEILERVGAHYQMPASQITTDVRQVLDQLKAEDLILER